MTRTISQPAFQDGSPVKKIIPIPIYIALIAFGVFLIYKGMAIKGVTITNLEGDEIEKFRGSFIGLLFIGGLTSICSGIAMTFMSIRKLISKGGV